MIKQLTIATVLFLASGACTDIGSFATEPGQCYRGDVVDAEFVLSGFASGTELYLTLDTAALSDGRGDAGLLWTSDGQFDNVRMSQIDQLANDSLSEFQFPGGRIRNYMVHAIASDGAPAMVIISLMENERVEVRILRPQVTVSDGVEIPTILPELFGVFRIKFDADCNAPYLN